jgi:hypothetical protein
VGLREECKGTRQVNCIPFLESCLTGPHIVYLTLYATIDDEIVTTEAQTDDDIVSEVKKDRAQEDAEEEEEEGGEECSEVPIPTVSDALEAIRVVNLFYESRGGSSEIVTKIMDIERNLESVYWASNRKEMKITVYCTRI